MTVRIRASPADDEGQLSHLGRSRATRPTLTASLRPTDMTSEFPTLTFVHRNVNHRRARESPNLLPP